MTKEELFLREGAFYAGHRMIYKQKDVGINVQAQGLVLTAEGEELYERLSGITDVEVKPVRAKKASPSPLDPMPGE